MKFLIWFACIFIYSILMTALKVNNVPLGGVEVAVLFGLTLLVAKALCKMHDTNSSTKSQSLAQPPADEKPSLPQTKKSAFIYRCWPGIDHSSPTQLEQLKATQTINVLEVDIDAKFVLAQGAESEVYRATLSGCTCPDYSQRALPCKHMYKLAMYIDSSRS